jgi:hypothetical protein
LEFADQGCDQSHLGTILYQQASAAWQLDFEPSTRRIRLAMRSGFQQSE